MICYKCRKQFQNFKSLSKHFRTDHKLTNHSIYQCVQNNCYQNFSNLNSFRKHLLLHIIRNRSRNLKETKEEKNDCSANEILNTRTSCSVSVLTYMDSETITEKGNDTSVIAANIIEINNVNNIDYDNVTTSHNIEIENEDKNDIKLSVLKFLTSLYAKSNLTVSDVKNIQSGINNDILKPIINQVQGTISLNHPNSNVLSNILNNIENSFMSYFKLKKMLQANDLISTYKIFTINNVISTGYNRGQISYRNKRTTGVLLPIRHQIKKFFEVDDNLNFYMKLISQLEQNTTLMSSFVQGKIWKEIKRKYENDDSKLIPFNLYVDDFGINNPLGSHSKSLTNVYYSFPVGESSSKLKNIFLAAILTASSTKKYGNNRCYEELVKEIIYLEEYGINIKGYKVRFILGLILGDNLGVNGILDYSKSFNSNYFCRFCKTPKHLTYTQCKEDPEKMRNIENYSKDIDAKNYNETGIVKESVFNSIKSFHVTRNFGVDLMHDMFEGICRYIICKALLYFIEEMKYFSIEILNLRKKLFNYGEIECGNVSSQIIKNHLLSNKLNMSAREMMTFMHFFPLMVGDLVPLGDEVWEFVTNLIEIIDQLLSFSIPKDEIYSIQRKIEKHNSDFIRLFNDKLKPKFHFLIHYPTIILNSGPPRGYWSLRYEAKHKEFKDYAKTISSRKNICVSMANKYQMKFANNILNDRNEDLICHENHKILTSYENYINENISHEKGSIESFKQIVYKGNTYKIGYYVIQNLDEMCVYEIKEIIKIKTRSYLICQQIKTIKYDKHFLSYEMNPIIYNSEEVLFEYIENFSGPPINLTLLGNGKVMMRAKEYY